MRKRLSDEISDIEIINMLKDTSKLASEEQIEQIQNVAIAYKQSNQLTNQVEFWKWLDRNFNGNNGHMFASNNAMLEYISQGKGKYDWVSKQIQGKGYEWDWIQKQRSSIKNIFKKYNAGDVANQASIDVTEYDFLSRKNTDYQMKAYISKNNPNLHNTDTNVTVVTNSEKATIVSDQGYAVEKYKNQGELLNDVDKRMNGIHDGTAKPQYTIKNVGGAMAKAGFIGCAFGIGTEAIFSYRSWKSGEISNEQYLEELMKAGGDAGITAAGTTGIMIPVSAMLTTAGISSIVTIPVAFVVSSGINKIVAPCFGRGEYRKILSKAYYYRDIELMYTKFMRNISISVGEYEYFIDEICNQNKEFEKLKDKNRKVTKSLKNLYDSI